MHKRKWVYLIAYFLIAIIIQPVAYELSEYSLDDKRNTSPRSTFTWSGIVDLDNDYLIATNDILTIEACSEINLDQGVSIIVEGRLIIEGTISCPVIMNNQGLGDHDGIYFESISKNKASKIDNLTIKNGDYGVTIFSSNPQFNNLIIENPDKVGIDIFNSASPSFENTIIEGGGWDEHGGISTTWRYGIGISVGNYSAPIFDNVYINGTLTRGINFWGNSGGLYSNIEISNVTGSTLAAATCLWIMDAIPYFENVNLNRCDNGIWVRQYDDSIQTNTVIHNSIIENSRFYGVIVDKHDHSNFTNTVMATFENLEISGTGGVNANGFQNNDGIAAIEINVSGAIFENVNLHDNPVPGLIAYLVDDTLFMRNINVTNCGKQGVFGHDSGVYIYAAFHNGPPELINVNVSNSPGSGIHVQDGATSGSNWNLYNNSGHGLYIDHASVFSNLINTQNNGKSGTYVYDSSNVLLQNLTSISNGDLASNNKEGSGIVFYLSNNVESNGRDVSCINCSSTDDAFGGIYVEDSIDLYLKNIFVSEPRNDGYGLYADNSGLTQTGHMNIDGMLLELNRSTAIVDINAAARISGLDIQGNIDEGLGMSWDGSAAAIESSIINSNIESKQCISFYNLIANGGQLICNGLMNIFNSDINITELIAVDSENVVIDIQDGNSLLHLHKPININLNLSIIGSGSKIEEAYDLDVWVLNQFHNGLPFANIDVIYTSFNDNQSITTDYLGHAIMSNYIVREWNSGVAGTTSSNDEQVNIFCTYDSTINNTGNQVFDDDLTLYCNLTLTNQAPFILWNSPEEDEIFPSKGVVEFDASNSWDLDNDLLSYSWSSNIDGELLVPGSECISPMMAQNYSAFLANQETQTGGGATTLECLSDGVHEITLEVCDDENLCSYETRTVTLTNLPAVVNMEVNPKTDGDGVLRIPRSTVVEFNASGTYDPENEDLTILLTDSYHMQAGQPPDNNMAWALSFVDSIEDTVTVTITFDDGVIGNIVTWNLEIILENELPKIDFTIERGDNFSNSIITLDGSSSFDPENDEITVVWFSSIDGLLLNGTGTDSLIWSGWLSSGIHEISLKIIDSEHQWNWVEKRINLNVENSPPIAVISNPNDDSPLTYLSSDKIVFIAHGSGDWDSSCESLEEELKGNIDWICNQNLPSVRSDLVSIKWMSNLDGILTLNSKNNFSGWEGRLSAGTHIITLEINDGNNAPVSTSITVNVSSSAPILILDSPDIENDEFRSNKSILFDLRKSIDYDGDDFTWSLENEAGVIFSNSEIQLNNINPNQIHFINLPNGIHELKLILTDSTGMQSIHNLTLSVLSSNPIASITSPTASFEGNSNTFTFKPGELINLTAEQSYDADDDILSYEWQMKTNSGSWQTIQTEGGGMNIEYLIEPGKYIFKLKVYDMLGGTGEKIINVITESSIPSLDELSVYPTNIIVDETSELRITVRLFDADKTTKNVSAKIILNSQIWYLTLSDNGSGGDATANDGIWTGILTWTPISEGFASIRVTATDIDLRYDEEVLDIKVGIGTFSIIELLGGGTNIAIGGFVITLLLSLGLAVLIRKKSLRTIDLDEYIESWDSLVTESKNKDPEIIIDDDELDL